MVWDKNEKALTTVGGRIEINEDIDTALNRETIQEAGLILKHIRFSRISIFDIHKEIRGTSAIETTPCLERWFTDRV